MLYFSWIRERVGMGEEMLGLPNSVETVEQLLNVDDESSAEPFEPEA